MDLTDATLCHVEQLTDLSQEQLLDLQEAGCALLAPDRQGGVIKLFAGRRLFRLV